ncbi:WD40 repeat domain-containing protein, partial [Synechococcus sp. CS-1326]
MTSALSSLQIQKYGSRLLGFRLWPGLSRRWQQQRAIRKLAADGSTAAVKALAFAAVQESLCDGIAYQALIDSLGAFREVMQLRMIAETAVKYQQKSGSKQLFSILMAADLYSRLPVELRIAVAMACNTPERLVDDGPEVVPALLDAWSDHSSCEMACRTLQFLLQRPSWIDSFCNHWMMFGADGDELINLLLSASHAPSDPSDRALFWILSGQLQRYEELDLDGTLLAQAHVAASPPLRKRLAEVAARAGRPEWLRAMQDTKPLDTFTEEDWDTTVALLKRAGDSEALWQWALQAPPLHSLCLLRALPADTPQQVSFKESEPKLMQLMQLVQELQIKENLPFLLPDRSNHILEGHSRGVSSIAWSPDESWLASGSDDETIRMWDSTSGRCTHTLEGHSRGVSSIAWSPDGSWLASGSEDKTIRMWDSTSGRCTHILEGHSRGVSSIAWSPDGSWLASGSDDETIRMWDSTSGRCTHILEGHSRGVSSIAWSPDGSWLASGSEDKTIRMWDSTSGRCTHTLEGHSDWVR